MQTVLEQRERQETLARQGFAEAETAMRRAQEFLVELQEIRAALLAELCDRRDGSFDPLETRLYQDYMQTIAQSIREQEAYVRELGTTREAQKLHMITAAQNRQAMLTVRDRDRQAHIRQSQRREQNQIDEMATARFNHQQRGME